MIGSRGRARPLSIADWSSLTMPGASGVGPGGGGRRTGGVRGWGLEVDEVAFGGYGDGGVGAEAGGEGVEGVVGAVRLVVEQQDAAGAGAVGQG